MRSRALAAVAASGALAALLLPAGAAGATKATDLRQYTVLYAPGASIASAHAALRQLDARIVSENRDIGVATVSTRTRGFVAAATRRSALSGAAVVREIGRTPGAGAAKRRQGRIEREGVGVLKNSAAADAARRHPPLPNADPLSGLQWDMNLMHANVNGSYRREPGDPGVKVGIIDTGVDGTHPDIAANFDAADSHNFTTDIPLIDGPCEEVSCQDPNNVDDNGHGTHVAGTIASPLNGIGMSGVAPKVSIVNLRAGQDSGYFFIQPTVDALTAAGDEGVDVVNMSFYIDPWLYNCADNPADSPEQQLEQRTIIAATQRALNYAHRHGVTLISALGNENTDLGNPTSDATSPDYPPDAPYERTVNNSCLSMPTEAKHVIGVSAIGPTTRKSYYSNYGVEQTEVAAPGGDRRDYFGTPQYNAPETRILAPYPENVAVAEGRIDANGIPTDPLVVRNCANGTCALYQWIQGTSMASPHAVGVAALIVSRYGKRDRVHGGLTMDPDEVQKVLFRTATKHACPTPRLFHYPDPDLPPAYDALCVGGTSFNGFYGHGIVDALAAVTR